MRHMYCAITRPWQQQTTMTKKPTNNWHLIFYFIFLTTLFKDILLMAEWQSCKIHTRLENHAVQNYLEQRQGDTKTSIKTAKHQIICHANMETVITLLSSVYNQWGINPERLTKSLWKHFELLCSHIDTWTYRQTDRLHKLLHVVSATKC